MASRAQFWVSQDHIVRDNESYNMKSHFDRVLDDLIGTIMTFDLRSFT